MKIKTSQDVEKMKLLNELISEGYLEHRITNKGSEFRLTKKGRQEAKKQEAKDE